MNSVARAEHNLDSPLLRKLQHLGFHLPLDLERLAVARECDYYERELPPRLLPIGDVPVSNDELAVALVARDLNGTAREIRLAAALLGSPDVHADEIARLATQEGCTDVIRYIARCGHQFEPENSFWENLLNLLPGADVKTRELPHPTRFIEMTGMDRGKVGVFRRWIRPRLAVGE